MQQVTFALQTAGTAQELLPNMQLQAAAYREYILQQFVQHEADAGCSSQLEHMLEMALKEVASAWASQAVIVATAEGPVRFLRLEFHPESRLLLFGSSPFLEPHQRLPMQLNNLVRLHYQLSDGRQCAVALPVEADGPSHFSCWILTARGISTAQHSIKIGACP